MAIVSVSVRYHFPLLQNFYLMFGGCFPCVGAPASDQVSIFWPAAAHNGDSHIVTTTQGTRNKQTGSSNVGEFRLDPPFNNRHRSSVVHSVDIQ